MMSLMSYIYIDQQEKLEHCCQQFWLESVQVIAIDCEFERQFTYIPQLSLIQLAYKDDEAWIIDVLRIDNLDPLMQIIYDHNIVKVFHDSKQDLEILFYLKKGLPSNLFDTQLAYMALNGQPDISYSKLVKLYLHHQLDKALQCSKFLERPLSDDQLQYAANDVIYLLKLYYVMSKKLIKQNKWQYIHEHLLRLEDSHYYMHRHERYFHKLLKYHELQKAPSLLYDLLVWRETVAYSLNINANSVCSLEFIKNLVLAALHNKDLTMVFNNHVLLLPEYQDQLLDLIASHQVDTSLMIDILFNKKLTTQQEYLYEILKIILNKVANHLGIHYLLITDYNDLKRYLLDSQTKVLFMQGWRYQVFGQEIEMWLNNSNALVVDDNGKLSFAPLNVN